MATLVERVSLLAQRLGADVKALRSGKADDSAVVHLTGAETLSGVKTFGSAPVVPTGSAAGNPVRRDDGRLSDSRFPTAHGHPQSDVTGLVSALAVLRNAVNGSQGDTAQGDTISSFPRVLAGSATALVNGTLYATGVVAASADSATKLRIALGSPQYTPSGGTLNYGVYIGNSPSSLALAATATSAAPNGALLELTLSQGVSWQAGQIVLVTILPLGWATGTNTSMPSPRFASGGGPGSALLNTPLRLVVGQTGVAATPSTYSTSSGGGAGNAPWWALA